MRLNKIDKSYIIIFYRSAIIHNTYYYLSVFHEFRLTDKKGSEHLEQVYYTESRLLELDSVDFSLYSDSKWSLSWKKLH